MTQPQDMSGPIISVRDLSVTFAGRDRKQAPIRAVEGVSFQLRRGRCTALVGESGSGKSVTARSLLGLNPPHATVMADELTIGGRDAQSFGSRDWRSVRGAQIGYVLQDALGSMDSRRTVGAEVAEALRIHRRELSRAETAAEVRNLLRRCHIPDVERRIRERPPELSGGLRQRALIASALAGDPQVLIADEPTTALDVAVQEQILELFAELKDSGLAVLLITHDLSAVEKIADDCVVLRRGVVVESGDTERIVHAPREQYTKDLLDAAPYLQPVVDSPAPVVATTPLVSVESVSKTFKSSGGGSRKVLDGVSLTISRGTTLGLVGESGSGKTTLSRIIAGLETADTGVVRWHKPSASTQFVYQDPLSSFDPRYSAGRVIAEGVRAGAAQPRGRGATSEAVAQWLRRVGLDPGLARRRPLELSGGQRQRLAIARALAARPVVLVLDEPVSALDVVVQAEILDLLAQLQKETQVAMVFISHDLAVVQQVSDEVLVLRDGIVHDYADARTIYSSPHSDYTRALLAASPIDPRARLRTAGTRAPLDPLAAQTH